MNFKFTYEVGPMITVFIVATFAVYIGVGKYVLKHTTIA